MRSLCTATAEKPMQQHRPRHPIINKQNNNFKKKLSSKLLGELKLDGTGDLPSGPVVKNPRSNAEDMSLIPGQGTKIPYAGGGGEEVTEPAHPC